MKNWQSVLVGPNVSLREALKIIDGAGSQLAVVVDDQRRLLGTLSDGDARRALLNGLDMTDRVSRAMHPQPTVISAADTPFEVLATMRRTGLHQLPIVTEQREIVGLALINDYLQVPHRDNWVIIMAGGPGSRLQELTRETPKPMLKVGSRPLLETIICSYADQGFRHFYLAVNYKAEQIKSHFDNGHKFGVDIRYLREEQRLGTAGALSLLPQRPTHPMIVANADVLTKEDFGHMVDHHCASQSHVTVAVRDYDMQVPFGVVNASDGNIQFIEEKPIQRFVVSAGICVLSPEVLDLVPTNQYFDMPDLFAAALAAKLRSRTHHVEGYWMDIGRVPDYERANVEFNDVFR